MSNFKIKAVKKDTKETHDVWVISDYFGRHNYGYVPKVKGEKAMTEEEFESHYEEQYAA